MSSFLSSDTFSNPRFQLFAAAVFSAATTASLLLGYQALEREERVYELKNSIPADDPNIQPVISSLSLLNPLAN
jgi:tRNA threonylcarbamoyladenosine dehydratase